MRLDDCKNCLFYFDSKKDQVLCALEDNIEPKIVQKSEEDGEYHVINCPVERIKAKSLVS